jgi:hypothetical protein
MNAEDALVAREMITKLIALARERQDEPRLAMALHTHGHACILADELEEAEKAFDESREIALRLGDKRAAAITLAMLGYVAMCGKKLEEGLPRIVSALVDIEAEDPARAAIATRLGVASKKFEAGRFDAALKAASRSHPKELHDELSQAVVAARKAS